MTSFQCDKLLRCRGGGLLLLGRYHGNHLLLLLRGNLPRLLLDNDLQADQRWGREHTVMIPILIIMTKQTGRV